MVLSIISMGPFCNLPKLSVSATEKAQGSLDSPSRDSGTLIPGGKGSSFRHPAYQVSAQAISGRGPSACPVSFPPPSVSQDRRGSKQNGSGESSDFGS